MIVWLIISLLLSTPAVLAEPATDIGLCEGEEYGYIVVYREDGKLYLYLSDTPQQDDSTVKCYLEHGLLIKIVGKGREI